MKIDEVTLKINTGYFIKQLDVISEQLKIMSDKLKDIPNNYCEVCSCELLESEWQLSHDYADCIIKYCPKCKEQYFIK